MTDTFSRASLRSTPRTAARRRLYDPSLDEVEVGCVRSAGPAEPTDPSIYRMSSDFDVDMGPGPDGDYEDPTLEPGVFRAPQPSALRGMALALGLLGGGAAVAAALLFGLAAALGAALLASEGGPSIAGEASSVPAPTLDVP